MNSITELRKELEEMPQDAPILVIEKTAKRLEDMNFSPILLTEIPDFLHLTNRRALEQFDKISESGENIIKQLNLLVYWYRLLVELRQDVPEAWDEVNELYEDD